MFTLLSILFGNDDENKKNNSIYSEEELDAFGLFENEKDEVRKGNQSPWDFEEDPDEDDDDDFYGEDD